MSIELCSAAAAEAHAEEASGNRRTSATSPASPASPASSVSSADASSPSTSPSSDAGRSGHDGRKGNKHYGSTRQHEYVMERKQNVGAEVPKENGIDEDEVVELIEFENEALVLGGGPELLRRGARGPFRMRAESRSRGNSRPREVTASTSQN